MKKREDILDLHFKSTFNNVQEFIMCMEILSTKKKKTTLENVFLTTHFFKKTFGRQFRSQCGVRERSGIPLVQHFTKNEKL